MYSRLRYNGWLVETVASTIYKEGEREAVTEESESGWESGRERGMEIVGEGGERERGIEGGRDRGREMGREGYREAGRDRVRKVESEELKKWERVMFGCAVGNLSNVQNVSDLTCPLDVLVYTRLS